MTMLDFSIAAKRANGTHKKESKCCASSHLHTLVQGCRKSEFILTLHRLNGNQATFQTDLCRIDRSVEHDVKPYRGKMRILFGKVLH